MDLGNLMDAADQLSGIGDSLMDVGERAMGAYTNVEDATTKVTARFGEVGDAAKESADIVKAVYEGGYGDSMDAVAEAVILVKENIKDLDGTSLQNITQQALVLQDVYGIDMSESLRGVSGLMNNFQTDAQTAMDYLVAGTQNGLDKTNELGDNLSEYSGKFSQAGYSINEYLQLLNNGLEMCIRDSIGDVQLCKIQHNKNGGMG